MEETRIEQDGWLSRVVILQINENTLTATVYDKHELRGAGTGQQVTQKEISLSSTGKAPSFSQYWSLFSLCLRHLDAVIGIRALWWLNRNH